MRTRPTLKPGDTIGVMAPSSHVERDDIEQSKAFLENFGYNVFIHPQTFEREHQSAGTHLQKALAFQGLWMRDDIHAIWAAGGGNRALHLLDVINFEKLNQKSKALIGFSDITALLNIVSDKNNLVTFHGQVFKNLHKQQDHAHQMLALLENKTTSHVFSDTTVLKEGRAIGHLIGGNLSVFQYLLHQLSDTYLNDAILFIEDCNEELNHIDRMLLHLKQTGLLNRINGLIFGEFSNLKDSGRPYGYTFKDIAEEHLSQMEYPVLLNAPFGHGEKQFPLAVGASVILDTKSQTINFS